MVRIATRSLPGATRLAAAGRACDHGHEPPHDEPRARWPQRFGIRGIMRDRDARTDL